MTRNEIVIQRNSDFLNALAGPHGKRVLTHLSKFCLEHRSTFVEGDGRKSDFNEGARSVILEIRRWLDYDISKLEPDEEEGD